MFKWIYLLLLVSSVGLIFWKGRIEERVIMAALAFGSVFTAILHARADGSWLTIDIALLANELVVTIVILIVAYRSKSFWPIPIASFQLLAFLTPLTTILGENLASYALGVMQGMWAYLQLLILLLVVSARWRSERKSPGRR